MSNDMAVALAYLGIETVRVLHHRQQVHETAAWRVASILSGVLADFDRRLTVDMAGVSAEVAAAMQQHREAITSAVPQDFAAKVFAIRLRQTQEQALQQAEARAREQTEQRAQELLAEIIAQGLTLLPSESKPEQPSEDSEAKG